MDILLAFGTPHVTVVGDDDQRIYSFRGALPRGFDHLRTAAEAAHPGRAVASRQLESNYRSTGNILAVATFVLSGVKDRVEKQLRATAAAGEPVDLWEFETEYDEARGVAAELARQREACGRRWGDCAVLLRNLRIGPQRPTEPFQEALLARGIPFELVRGGHVLDRCATSPSSRDVTSRAHVKAWAT